MHCWNPHTDTLGICGAGSPDAIIGVSVTLSADLNGCGFIDGGCNGDIGSSNIKVQFKPNDSGNPGVVLTYTTNNVDESNANVSYAYTAAQATRPEVRVCNTALTTCSDWDKWDVALVEYDLDVGTNTPPGSTMQWWSPCYTIIGCSAGSPDGVPQNFTLTADYDDSDNYAGSRIVSVQWDFDGNGSVDQTDTFGPLNSASGTRTTTHYYSEGVYQPQARFCDNGGGCGGWDKKDILGVNTDLDVVDADPATPSMDWWSPCYTTLGLCSGGSPDGRPSTVFTFNADGFSDDVGVDYVEWDFDGNGTVDATTDLPNGTGTYNDVTITHAYGSSVIVQPQVRAVDTGGQRSSWDKKDIALINVDLDTVVTAPSVTQNWWTPCATTLGLCSGGSPDGRPSTAFTFSADVSDNDQSLGGKVTSVEWDFDGNGTVDDTTSVAGGAGCGSCTVTTTHSYGAVVTVQPQVRSVDNDGARSGWDKVDIAGINVDLDTVVTPPDATMQWWSPCFEIVGCSAGSPDGFPGNYTLNADYSDGDAGLGGRVVEAQWDFDGNGTVDQYQAVTDTSGSGSVSVVHAYAKGVYQPQVRFKDNDGALSGWDKKDILGIATDLDVVDDPPTVTMEWWSPCYEIIGCAGGSPDGRPSTTFTFNATGSDDIGVASYEWDFDGNGTVDATTAGASTTHSYGAAVTVQPQVRSVDTSGQRSGWDKKDIAFINVDLDTVVTPPDGTMQWWSPCYTIIGCSGGSPDGAPGNYTLNADFSDGDAGLGGRITSVEWDFDGDGTADQTQAVTDTSGSGSVSVVHNYSAGIYQPQVRFQDNDGAYSGWDKKDDIACFGNCDLDVVDDPPTASMDWWSPCYTILGLCSGGAPDGTPSTNFTFNATGSDDYGVTGYEWDFDGDNVVDASTATGTTTHTYGVAGVFTPHVRTVDTAGQRSGWDAMDILGVDIDLDTAVSAPDATMQWWSPCFEILGLCSAGSPDGVPGNFTLNADYHDSHAASGGRIVEVQWDFGDGSPVTILPVTDTTGSGSVSIVHAYTSGVYQPQVRFKNNDGVYGGWDRKDILGIDTDLDVVDDPPSVSMDWWSPCYTVLGLCSGGSPDGRSNQSFTLNATGSDDIGVASYEWDFDGDGTVDATTAGNSTTHTYGVIGSWQPQVRAVDTSGQRSGWDKLDILFIPVDLDTAGPSMTVDNPQPCFGIYPACIHGAPDASTGDVVTLHGSYDDPFGVAVDHVDIDVNGDLVTDYTVAASGTSGSITQTHTYAAAGTYTINMRAVGVDGAVGAWDNWSILGIDADYDVGSAQVRAQMGCWDPHDTIVICGAGSHDVRAGTPVTLNADLDTCAALCIGNYFSPTDINDYDIEWRLGDGSPSVIQSISGGSDRSLTVPSGYGAVGAYRPEVRLCDDAATSTNCSSWDRYDVVLVEYDLDAYGPEATMQWWSPCFEVLGLCSPGAPDGGPSTTFTFTADFNDPDSGRTVTQAQWDYNDDGVVDATTAVVPAAQSGTATSTYSYGAELVTEPQVRFVSDDGAVGAWDKYDNVLCLTDFECDLDVGITPPSAKATFHPQNHLLGNDGDTLTNFTFDATGSSDEGSIVQYRWDFNGDSVIDRTTATATTAMTYDSFGFGAGSYAATVTVVDNDGATATAQVTDDVTGLIPVTVDVGAACVGDADHDGVPCRFDPDGDTTPYNHQLNYVRSTGTGPIWTNWVPDAAVTAGLNVNRTMFFGKPFWFGAFNMINADVVLNSGSPIDVQWTSLSLWADTGIGSAPDTAYLKGISFCTGKAPGTFFGIKFGLCTYQASIDDDQETLEVEDEIYFRTYLSGWGVMEYEGFTLPLISPEVQVNVNP